MSTKTTFDSCSRRQQILTALTVTPLDSRQLCSLSRTFDKPFTDEQFVRRVMARLVRDRYVLEFIFPDRTKYWKPSQLGYQLVYGPDKPLPGRRAYRSVSPSLERHTRRLADLLVKLQVTANEQDIELAFIYGDGQTTMSHKSAVKIPDAVIGLKMKRRKTYTLVIELDCGTEPVYSSKARDSLDKMVSFYTDHESAIGGSYRVLVLFDQASARMHHFLDRVAAMNGDPRRRVIKAALLDTVLQHDDPLTWPILIDEDRQLSAMLPGREINAQTIPSPFLDVPIFA